MTAERRLIVTALLTTAVAALFVGLPATLAPHGFYDHFPFVRAWVHLLPPYNEHLVRDVGELQLGYGLLFLWAAYRPSPQLVVPLCCTWALGQALHSIYHLINLDGFAAGDAAAQTFALAAATAVPLLPVWLLRRRPQPHARGIGTGR